MQNIMKAIEALGSFLVGLLATRALYIEKGWWLNSGQEVLRTTVVLAMLGAFAAIWRTGSPWVRASGLWTGALLEMTILLFLNGPGTIWPIVLVFAAVITATAVFGGAWAGATLSRLWM